MSEFKGSFATGKGHWPSRQEELWIRKQEEYKFWQTKTNDLAIKCELCHQKLKSMVLRAAAYSSIFDMTEALSERPCHTGNTIANTSTSQVNVPKTRRTYCKGKDCKKHTQHKVTQYKAGKVRPQSPLLPSQTGDPFDRRNQETLTPPFPFQASSVAQGKRRYDRKQSGYGGQTKPVFHKKAKTTKKVVLRLECTNCKTKAQLALKRCKHFELGYVDLVVHYE